MPGRTEVSTQEQLFQRAQYAKGGVGRWYWDHRDQAILSEVSGRFLLDLGCGEGITLQRLIACFSQEVIFGLDGLLENLDICRTLGLPVLGGDVCALPFRAESQDCLLLIEVIEHLRRPMASLREAFRVLRPQGRLVLLFPNDPMFVFARILTGKWREARFDAGHVRQWTPARAARALHAAGFATVRGFGLPFDCWPWCLHYLVVAEKPVPPPHGDNSRLSQPGPVS